MTEFYFGTMGFSYEDWKGVFYPSGVPSREFLKQYARIFNTVEMDTTFYAIPRPAVVQGWAASVPENFRFTAKTPQSITHEMGLANTGQFMSEFLNIMRNLGDKLAVILIQLPPKYTSDNLTAFTAFLDDLPSDIHFAVEFRHSSWYTPQIGDLLTEHQIGWVATEYAAMPHQIIPTADFLYIRWLGRRGTFQRYTHEQVDRGPRLAWWRAQIQPCLNRVQRVYGFFNNEYSGFAPETCNRFKRMLNLPNVDFQQPVQRRLF